jgi:aromatic ring-opening dioxygenase catalytic subunit (LigB family)
MPCVYVSHGGGPMPLMGRQPDIVIAMKETVYNLPYRPTSILIISAHYETSSGFEVTSGSNHDLMYDYGGFSPETYQYKYPAPGNPTLAQNVCQLMKE